MAKRKAGMVAAGQTSREAAQTLIYQVSEDPWQAGQPHFSFPGGREGKVVAEGCINQCIPCYILHLACCCGMYSKQRMRALKYRKASRGCRVLMVDEACRVVDGHVPL